MKKKNAVRFSIRVLYLYLFAFVGLLIVVIGAVRLVDLGLKVYVFRDADVYRFMDPMIGPDGKEASPSPEYKRKIEEQQTEENNRQRQRTTAEALAMIMVGVPLYLYHWKMIKDEA